MNSGLTIDLGLFGISPDMAVYDGLTGRLADFAGGAALVLDTKAQAPLDPFLDMQGMLLDMTKELRERFQRFQSQTLAAERDAGSADDEASRKLAQTDAKAAIEAVSLIVRTLEKIDSLQRTLINERAEAEAARGEPDDGEALAVEFERLVAERVEDQFSAREDEWKRKYGIGGAGGEACGKNPGGRSENGP